MWGRRKCEATCGRSSLILLFALTAAALCLLIAASVCLAGVRWTAGGIAISTEVNDQLDPRIISDGSGGAIITWEDYYYGSSDVDIWAQKVNSSGTAQWYDNGIKVCWELENQLDPEITSDGSGGAIITWKDYRSGSYDIYAQRVNSSGNIQWTYDGVAICTATSSQTKPQITPDGSGGAIITWEDLRSGNYDIYAQRVDSSGTTRWAANGVLICNMPNALDPRIIPDGNGGAVITWQDSRSGNYDIYAQKVNSAGNVHWTANGVEICTEVSDQCNPKITSDGSGGAIITWRDARFGSSDYDIYAQRVNSSGLILWNYNGVSVCSRTENQTSPEITSDGAGGAIITWQDYYQGASDIDIYAQRVDSDGSTLWDYNGVCICSESYNQEEPRITTDGSGGAIITWQDYRSNWNYDIYAQRVDSSGIIRWTANGVPVCNSANDQKYPELISDGSGGAIITWQDYRSGADWDIYAQRVSNPAPTVTSITPDGAGNTGTVSLTNLAGTNFASEATVKLQKSGQADINASNVSVVSSTKLTCKFNLSGASTGAYTLKVTNPDGQSSTKSNAFTVTSPTPPPPNPPTPTPTTSDTWYLAEGTTAWGYSTYISIENPNESDVTARVTYMTDQGPVQRPDITLPAMSQTTLFPIDDLGEKDFSTKVECLEGKAIAADRTMFWFGEDAASESAHCSIGVTSPAKTWYLPEGSTNYGFETFLLVQNPNDSEVRVEVTFMKEDGPLPLEPFNMPANSRRTIRVNDDMPNADFSTKVEADKPVIPERAMYRHNRSEGHDSIGTTSPAQDYYLAEGTTGWGFTTYVLVQNPNDTDTDVTVTYMTGSGPVPQAPFTMPANSRHTIRVNDVMPDTDFSTQVTGTNPIIAERAMYWDSWAGEACHDSIGMSSPHTTFYLPDGWTDGGCETWTLVQNPNDTDVEVEISYLTASGYGNVTFADTVPANSRWTYNMADRLPGETAAILVTSKTSGEKIMVERAMYWDNRGAGTDTIGGYSD
ncbi:MAG: hypothetical protein KKB90_01060 [Actinobacteria bacterium]|nr:hypothetical protein [Actinomycetota bacterium]MCG2818803.1 hypothetical protein [Actinomycetes bacterium]MBU4217537.1 hypothetical protein [Actinomycetota bacterium]MBU4358541.1 hypothetical protein [Actinomycetota bacterium]MBU4391397.1 hypothetical protein [Actinomycetota bacterium]